LLGCWGEYFTKRRLGKVLEKTGKQFRKLRDIHTGLYPTGESWWVDEERVGVEKLV